MVHDYFMIRVCSRGRISIYYCTYLFILFFPSFQCHRPLPRQAGSKTFTILTLTLTQRGSSKGVPCSHHPHPVKDGKMATATRNLPPLSPEPTISHSQQGGVPRLVAIQCIRFSSEAIIQSILCHGGGCSRQSRLSSMIRIIPIAVAEVLLIQEVFTAYAPDKAQHVRRYLLQRVEFERLHFDATSSAD